LPTDGYNSYISAPIESELGNEEEERRDMLEIQIKDNSRYEKALGILHRMGGMFRTRHKHILIVGPGQYAELVRAGVVEAKGTKTGNGGKKKKAV
jgi:hypothetical protein